MRRKKRNKPQNSTCHGVERFKERMPEVDKDRTSMIRKAILYGSSPDQFTGKFKSFLYYKAKKHNKKVKVYRGYIYIYFKTSNRLITVYKVPDEFQNETNIHGVNVNDIHESE